MTIAHFRFLLYALLFLSGLAILASTYSEIDLQWVDGVYRSADELTLDSPGRGLWENLCAQSEGVKNTSILLMSLSLAKTRALVSFPR
jgi:hypothetical protein